MVFDIEEAYRMRRGFMKVERRAAAGGSVTSLDTSQFVEFWRVATPLKMCEHFNVNREMK